MKAYDMYESNDITYFSKTLSSVQIMSFDRVNLKSFLSSKNSSKPSLYILYNDGVLGSSSIYIGETENIGKRLEQHNSNFGKTFWTGTIVMQTSDDSFNKAHYKYLEYLLYTRAQYAERYDIINKVSPSKTSLSAKDEISAKVFLEEIYSLMIKLRFYFFEHPQLGNTNEDKDIFYLYHSYGTGKIQVKDESDMNLLKDSVIFLDKEDDPFKSDKEKLIKEGHIKEIEETKLGLVVKEIHFNSDNEAAAFVLGDVNADWTIWQNIDGNQTTIMRK